MSNKQKVIIARNSSFGVIGLNDEDFILKELEIAHNNADIVFDRNDVEVFYEEIEISNEIHRHDIIEGVYQRLEAIVEVNLERSEAQKLIEFSRKAEVNSKSFLIYVFELFGANIICPSGSSLIW